MGNNTNKTFWCDYQGPDELNNYYYHLNLEDLEPTNLSENLIFDEAWYSNDNDYLTTGNYNSNSIYGGYQIYPITSPCYLLSLDNTTIKVKEGDSYYLPALEPKWRYENFEVQIYDPKLEKFYS
jgi:hypothetical protein